jgi:hypothetical protein
MSVGALTQGPNEAFISAKLKGFGVRVADGLAVSIGVAEIAGVT